MIGTPICRTAALIASTASPSAAPGARLNDIVTAGNWLWWLIDSGCTGIVLQCTKVDSGTAWPVDDLTYSLSSVVGSPAIAGGTSMIR